MIKKTAKQINATQKRKPQFMARGSSFRRGNMISAMPSLSIAPQ